MIRKILRSNIVVTGISLAVLGVLIFGGAIALNSGKTSDANTTAILTDIGALPVTVAELNKHAIDHGLTFYWLGERADSFMTIAHKNAGVVTLTYDSNSEKGSVTDSPDIIVHTYFDEASYQSALGGNLQIANDETVSNSRGDVVVINPDSLNEMGVKPRGKDVYLHLKYETKQTEASLIADSERLEEFKTF